MQRSRTIDGRYRVCGAAAFGEFGFKFIDKGTARRHPSDVDTVLDVFPFAPAKTRLMQMYRPLGSPDRRFNGVNDDARAGMHQML